MTVVRLREEQDKRNAVQETDLAIVIIYLKGLLHQNDKAHYIRFLVVVQLDAQILFNVFIYL